MGQFSVSDKCLREDSVHIKKISNVVKKDIKILVSCLKNMKPPFFVTTGLAAPQIGIKKRIIVFSYLKKYNVMINPKIVKRAVPFFAFETCSSFPNKLRLKIRHSYIKVKYLGIDKKEHYLDFYSSAAGTIEHEIDHLDGKLIID